MVLVFLFISVFFDVVIMIGFMISGIFCVSFFRMLIIVLMVL